MTKVFTDSLYLDDNQQTYDQEDEQPELAKEESNTSEEIDDEMLNRRKRVNYGSVSSKPGRTNPNEISLHDEENDLHKVTVDDGYEGDPTTFEVADPIIGTYVTYTVKGYDNEGPFEGTRRYNDFFHLRNTLLNTMPGIYIPPIPPKKMIGNKNEQFLEERKYFLQRFLQKI